MGQDEFVLPIHQENIQLKKDIKEMLLYIKEIQRNYITNQKLFECMVRNTYILAENKATQTEEIVTSLKSKSKVAKPKELKFQLQRNWSQPLGQTADIAN